MNNTNDILLKIKAGTASIIAALQDGIGNQHLVLNTRVTEITDEGEHSRITDSLQNNFFCKLVIVALPPKLLVETILFSPQYRNSYKPLCGKPKPG